MHERFEHGPKLSSRNSQTSDSGPCSRRYRTTINVPGSRQKSASQYNASETIERFRTFPNPDRASVLACV